MMIQPAEIVGIPFPYTDMSTHKRRPVLVMTHPDRRDDFIGLAITSVPTEDMAVRLEPECMKSGKLPKTSWVRYDKIFTLSVSLVKTRYGSVGDEMFKHVSRGLCAYLGCRSAERILAVRGSGFGGPGHFRLAFCADDDTIVKAMSWFRRVMERYKG